MNTPTRCPVPQPSPAGKLQQVNKIAEAAWKEGRHRLAEVRGFVVVGTSESGYPIHREARKSILDLDTDERFQVKYRLLNQETADA